MGVFVSNAAAIVLMNLLGTSVEIAAAVLRLFTNNKVPANLDALGDYTEATFAGYAAAAVSLGGLPAQVNANGSVILPGVGFTPATATGVGLPETVYGCYLTDAANTKLLAAARFDSPIDFTLVNQSLDYLVGIGMVNNNPDSVRPSVCQDGWTQMSYGALTVGGIADYNHS